MGGGVPKQFLEVRGRPIIRWAFEAVLGSGIQQIVVVVPRDRVEETAVLLPESTRVVAGGETRQQSVRNGLDSIEAVRVIVHDAARPFAPRSLFVSVLQALDVSDAAVPGLPMKETVKTVRDGFVVETLPREDVWNIQTPQGFRAATLKEAHHRAATEGVTATDDAQLVEHYGGRVKVVLGDPLAFKVTDAADVQRADAAADGLQA